MIPLDARLALHPQVRFRRFEDEGILLDQKSGEALVVSDVATRLLELTDGSRPLHDAVAILAHEYDASTPQIEEDVLRFAAELAEAGLVTVAEP